MSASMSIGLNLRVDLTMRIREILALGSYMKALVAWNVMLLVADIFVVSCAHSHSDVAHHRHRSVHVLGVHGHHIQRGRRLLGVEVVRTRWRRGHMTHGDVIGRRKLAKRRRRIHDDDGVVVRETDKMAAEAINGLFGPRHFAPISPLHLPAKHGRGPSVKAAAPGHDKHKHRHRHHHKTGGRPTSVSSQKTFMLELPVGCEAEPCQHDGDCYTDPTSPLGYTCRCQPGYTGDFCEIGISAVQIG